MITFNCNNCDIDGNCTCFELLEKKQDLIQLKKEKEKSELLDKVLERVNNHQVAMDDEHITVTPLFDVVKVQKQIQIEEPDYYNKGINTSDYIDSWNFNFNIGCVVKYVSRCENKHESPKDDLLKAHWYLSKELKRRGWLEETAMAKKHAEKLDGFGELLDKVHENDVKDLNKEITALNKLLSIREKQYADLQEKYNLATNPF